MKKIQLLKIICLSLVLVSIGCKKAAESGEPEEAEAVFDIAKAKADVEAGYVEFEKAFNAKDTVALAQCYASDAKFMPANDKAVSGRASIQKTFGMWFQGDMPQIDLQLLDVWGDADHLTVENSWTMTDQSGKVVDQGKALEVYKMEDGKWKILRDCFNSDLPPVPPAK